MPVQMRLRTPATRLKKELQKYCKQLLSKLTTERYIKKTLKIFRLPHTMIVVKTKRKLAIEQYSIEYQYLGLSKQVYML